MGGKVIGRRFQFDRRETTEQVIRLDRGIPKIPYRSSEQRVISGSHREMVQQ